MRWIIRDAIDAIMMIVVGAACGLLAAQIVTVREAMAVTVGYSLCAIGVTIRDHFFRPRPRSYSMRDGDFPPCYSTGCDGGPCEFDGDLCINGNAAPRASKPTDGSRP